MLVHEVMHTPSIEPLLQKTNGDRLREHLINSHTSSTDVGGIAAGGGVETLVLAHFVPGHSAVPGEIWLEDARKGFDGNIVLSEDLMIV